jgi:hypothetical protein
VADLPVRVVVAVVGALVALAVAEIFSLNSRVKS